MKRASTAPWAHRNTQGFTLIELMIVVVIIGILAAVALPKFSGMSKSAKQVEADPILKEVYTLQQAYYTRYNRYGTGTELATHGFLTELSNVATAHGEGRYFWIEITGTGGTGPTATYCAVAQLTTRGTDNGLDIKSMGSGRIITPGVATCS
jgi:prepilin-type N-terminal cleavage/methylation domain-containing protein